MSPESSGALVPLATAAGWIGQACFFSRFFLQWLASERARRSVLPRAFWWLSIGGSLLMSAYALYRDQPLLLAGFVVGGVISLRNLWLTKSGGGATNLLWVGTFALASIGILLWAELREAHQSHDASWPWLLVGGIGQLFWVSRFPVQWWFSERAGESHFPISFWWLSLGGNALLLVYALHLGDPVFVLGFVPGPIIQIRNLMLMRRFSGAS